MHPEELRLVPVGLPFGPKARLILAHLNAEALRTGTPEVEIESSLAAFVKRLRLDPKGRNVRIIKEQLARLSAASVRLGVVRDGKALTVNSQFVSAFDLWFRRDERHRVFWPSAVRLSLDYFDSLTKHAVPLDERALVALSHSALALDVYSWLAQQLHRIESGRSVAITWTALKGQFGWHYGRMDNFKRVFRDTLSAVASQYRAARFSLDGRGMVLRDSSPPVKAASRSSAKPDRADPAASDNPLNAAAYPRPLCRSDHGHFVGGGTVKARPLCRGIR
jgi:hypothetical protein